MDAALFRSLVAKCAILPSFLRDQLLTKSEELTPEARDRIASRLADAEAMHLSILEHKGNEILNMQHSLKALLRQDREAAESSSPIDL